MSEVGLPRPPKDNRWKGGAQIRSGTAAANKTLALAGFGTGPLHRQKGKSGALISVKGDVINQRHPISDCGATDPKRSTAQGAPPVPRYPVDGPAGEDLTLSGASKRLSDDKDWSAFFDWVPDTRGIALHGAPEDFLSSASQQTIARLSLKSTASVGPAVASNLPSLARGTSIASIMNPLASTCHPVEAGSIPPRPDSACKVAGQGTGHRSAKLGHAVANPASREPTPVVASTSIGGHGSRDATPDSLLHRSATQASLFARAPLPRLDSLREESSAGRTASASSSRHTRIPDDTSSSRRTALPLVSRPVQGTVGCPSTSHLPSCEYGEVGRFPCAAGPPQDKVIMPCPDQPSVGVGRSGSLAQPERPFSLPGAGPKETQPLVSPKGAPAGEAAEVVPGALREGHGLAGVPLSTPAGAKGVSRESLETTGDQTEALMGVAAEAGPVQEDVEDVREAVTASMDVVVGAGPNGRTAQDEDTLVTRVPNGSDEKPRLNVEANPPWAAVMTGKWQLLSAVLLGTAVGGKSPGELLPVPRGRGDPAGSSPASTAAVPSPQYGTLGEANGLVPSAPPEVVLPGGTASGTAGGCGDGLPPGHQTSVSAGTACRTVTSLHMQEAHYLGGTLPDLASSHRRSTMGGSVSPPLTPEPGRSKIVPPLPIAKALCVLRLPIRPPLRPRVPALPVGRYSDVIRTIPPEIRAEASSAEGHSPPCQPPRIVPRVLHVPPTPVVASAPVPAPQKSGVPLACQDPAGDRGSRPPGSCAVQGLGDWGTDLERTGGTALGAWLDPWRELAQAAADGKLFASSQESLPPTAAGGDGDGSGSLAPSIVQPSLHCTAIPPQKTDAVEAPREQATTLMPNLRQVCDTVPPPGPECCSSAKKDGCCDTMQCLAPQGSAVQGPQQVAVYNPGSLDAPRERVEGEGGEPHSPLYEAAAPHRKPSRASARTPIPAAVPTPAAHHPLPRRCDEGEASPNPDNVRAPPPNPAGLPASIPTPPQGGHPAPLPNSISSAPGHSSCIDASHCTLKVQLAVRTLPKEAENLDRLLGGSGFEPPPPLSPHTALKSSPEVDVESDIKGLVRDLESCSNRVLVPVGQSFGQGPPKKRAAGEELQASGTKRVHGLEPVAAGVLGSYSPGRDFQAAALAPLVVPRSQVPIAGPAMPSGPAPTSAPRVKPLLSPHAPPPQGPNFKAPASRGSLPWGRGGSAKRGPGARLICRFWKFGKCGKGVSCPFRHEGQPVSLLLHCTAFKTTGSCNKGDACMFSHDPHHVDPCKKMFKKGWCPRGQACPYSHEALAEGMTELLVAFWGEQERLETEFGKAKRKRVRGPHGAVGPAGAGGAKGAGRESKEFNEVEGAGSGAVAFSAKRQKLAEQTPVLPSVGAGASRESWSGKTPGRVSVIGLTDSMRGRGAMG